MKYFFTSILAFVIAGNIAAQPITDSLTASRNYLCSCQLGDKLFVTGDIVPGTDTVDVFDGTSGTWGISLMNLGLRMPLCRTVNDKVYFLSSSATYSIPLQDHIINYYNNTSGSWSTDTVPMSVNHFETIDYEVQVYNNDHLVFLNGFQNGWGEPSKIFALNTTNHTWWIDTIPDTLSGSRFSIRGDEAVWTSSGTEPVQYLVRYNLITHAIETDTLPVSIVNPLLYSTENITFITGGFLPFSAYTSPNFVMYDHQADTFRLETFSLGTPSVLRYGNNVLFGGQGTYSGLYSSNSGLVVIYDTDNDSLIIRNMSQPRLYYGLTANCGKFYLAGGFSYNQSNPVIHRDTIDIFDTLTFNRTTDQLIASRAQIAAGSVGQYIVFAGGSLGSTSNITPLSEAYTCQTLTTVEESNEYTLTVYPNPANDYFRIEMADFRNVYFELIDATGRKVKEGMMYDQAVSVKTADLPAGLYMLRIGEFSNKPKLARIVIAR